MVNQEFSMVINFQGYEKLKHLNKLTVKIITHTSYILCTFISLFRAVNTHGHLLDLLANFEQKSCDGGSPKGSNT